MSNIIVDLDTITARYGVHKTTIGEWVKKYPDMRKDKNKYDLVESDYAYIQILEERLENMGTAIKLKEAQTKNFELKNKLLELELEIKENRYLDGELIAEKINKFIHCLRLLIKQIPLEIAKKDIETSKKIEDLLNEKIDKLIWDEMRIEHLKNLGNYFDMDYFEDDLFFNFSVKIWELLDIFWAKTFNYDTDKVLKESVEDVIGKLNKILYPENYEDTEDTEDNEGILPS